MKSREITNFLILVFASVMNFVIPFLVGVGSSRILTKEYGWSYWTSIPTSILASIGLYFVWDKIQDFLGITPLVEADRERQREFVDFLRDKDPNKFEGLVRIEEKGAYEKR